MFVAHECAALAIGLYFRQYQPVPVNKFEKSVSRWLLPASCVAASVLPDLPRGYQMLVNKLHGLSLEAYFSSNMLWLGEQIHHVVWWLLLYAAIATYAWFKAWSLAVYACNVSVLFGVLVSHILLDALSHGHGSGFYGNNYFDPLPVKWAAAIGIFSYRDTVSLTIQAPEAFLIGFCLMSVVVLLATRPD